MKIIIYFKMLMRLLYYYMCAWYYLILRYINILYQKSLKRTFKSGFWLYKILCEFTALEHKLKRKFCSQKPVLNVRLKDRNKSDSDLVWQIQLINIKCICQIKSGSKIYILYQKSLIRSFHIRFLTTK